MTSRIGLCKFNEIYENTSCELLRYVIVKCHNISDANDILQETYLELWKILNKKDLEDINIKSYIIGIANNKIKKHFTLMQRLRTISLFGKDDNDLELIDNFQDEVDIESIVLLKDEWNMLWKYIKEKKNKDIPKVFYLFYRLDLSIKEISIELNSSESYIKHLLYRTLKELKINFGNGGNDDDK